MRFLQSVRAIGDAHGGDEMKRRIMSGVCVAAASLRTFQGLLAQGPDHDFGKFIEEQLMDHADHLFGIEHPLKKSSLGPFAGDAASALQVADHLKVSVVSTAVNPGADMIALWPDDENPTDSHYFKVDNRSPMQTAACWRTLRASRPLAPGTRTG
jgi:hypothetical protein